MARLLTAFVLTLALGAVVAPATPLPEEAKQLPLYWPTKVGTQLVYLRGQHEEMWEVTKVVDRDGGKMVTTEYVRAGGGRAPHQTVLVTTARVSLFEDAGAAYDPPWHLLRFPARRGDSWGVPEYFRRHLPGERMAVVGAEPVTVPAGRFETVVVEWRRGGPGGSRYAYAPGVGLVRLTESDGGTILALKSVTYPKGSR